MTDASQPLTKSLFDCKPTPEAGRIEKSGRTLSAKNRAALQNLYDDLGTFLADADAEKDKPNGETGTEEDKQQDGEEKGKKADKGTEKQPAEKPETDSEAAGTDTTDDTGKKPGDDNSAETTKKTKTTKEGKTMTKSEAEKLVQDAIAKALGQQTEQTPAAVTKAEDEEITPDFVQKAVDAAIKNALGQQEQEQKQEHQLTKADLEGFIEAIVKKSVAEVRGSRANPTNLNDASGIVQKSADQHYLHGIL